MHISYSGSRNKALHISPLDSSIVCNLKGDLGGSWEGSEASDTERVSKAVGRVFETTGGFRCGHGINRTKERTPFPDS